jgi:DNA-directed RNA polymerase subunit M/transcription elongation factor TFIIS
MGLQLFSRIYWFGQHVPCKKCGDKSHIAKKEDGEKFICAKCGAQNTYIEDSFQETNVSSVLRNAREMAGYRAT